MDRLPSCSLIFSLGGGDTGENYDNLNFVITLQSRLVFCFNKVLQTGCLKTTEIYSLIVLEGDV